MFRIWGKIIQDNKLIKDTLICNDDSTLTRTKKVFKVLEDISYEFDLPIPIWLEINQKDFIRFNRTRFTQDSYIETIEFDYLDFQVIEED